MFKARDTAKELLDRSDCGAALATDSYRFMEMINRHFGGIRVVRRFLAAEAAGVQGKAPLRVLDIGSGSCDIPLAVSQWAATAGIPLHFTCLEPAGHAFDIARERLARAGKPTVRVLQEDVFTHQPAEPYDCAVASMCFHHFSDAQILALVRRLRGFVRQSLLINDLRRSRLAALAARPLLFGAPAGVRHDALLSIRRGFKISELKALLGQLDGATATVASARWFRIAAILRFTTAENCEIGKNPCLAPRLAPCLKGLRARKTGQSARQGARQNVELRISQFSIHSRKRRKQVKTILKGLGTATAPLYTTQEDAYDFFTTHCQLKPAEQELYRRILLDGKIKGRYLGMDATIDALETDPDRLLARFLKFGRSTAVAAARRALAEAGVEPADIVGLVVNTCTGYLCPGLSSYIAEDLGLKTSIRFQDLMGMGCGGAVPNLEAATGMLARTGEGPVLSLAVEICSATIFPSHEPDLIVSNCIFGDGAAAAVLDLVPDDHPGGLARVLDFTTGLFPQYREDLRYRTEGGRLRNHLTKRVPVIGAQTAAEVASRLLDRHGLSRDDIDWWAVHPGGTVVLDQVAKKLELDAAAMRFSYHVFENYGNMSSPSVLFVLREILDHGRPQPGQKGMLVAFGAGFSAFAALIEFGSV